MIGSVENSPTLSLVKSGYVKRYLIGNDGNISVQSIYGPGDVFSLTAVFKVLLNQKLYEGPETYYYEAMSTVVIYTIDNDALELAATKNMAIYKDLFTEAGKRLHFNIQQLENLSLKTAYNRVAHVLVYLAKHFGETKGNSIHIKIPLTHQDLANLLSLTRETVTNSVIKLRDEGLIKTNRTITVLDIKQLQAAAFN